MRRVLASVFVLVAVLAGGALLGRGWPLWFAVSMVLVAIGLAIWLGRCPHDPPLALLPASTDIEGVALPPRWFCSTCGRTWAANFSKGQRPIAKFTGYDESKAVTSAKRAAELADRQRTLALHRAGMRPKSPGDVTRGQFGAGNSSAPVRRVQS